jgi:asparagine synthase (glutamine-hydrolysing)
MCGIWALLGKLASVDNKHLDLIRRLSPRGPEYVTFESIDEEIHFGFTRLAINGLTPLGNQPFHTSTSVSICNGEIYNYRDLADTIGIEIPEGASDCIVLNKLFETLTPEDACNAIDGVFALVYYNKETNRVIVARDPFGVRPLFVGITEDGSTIIASEIKSMVPYCKQIEQFQPGSYAIYNGETGNLIETNKYHKIKTKNIYGFDEAKRVLQNAVIDAVKKRVVVSDRPVGALLSGGLDSSLVAAIASNVLQMHGHKLQTFSIGMAGSSDLAYARKVADHIKSVHHEIILTPEEFLSAIPTVVQIAETYDITTVRATVGNYLVGKYIKEHTDVKVVLNGDGSDEIGGGYLYFFRAPSDEEFDSDCKRLLSEIHYFDVLRSDRGISSNGLEPRTPFLDKNVVNSWLSADVSFRRPMLSSSSNGAGMGAGAGASASSTTGQMEKFLLRKAFESTGLLPDEVLWRRKEAFSDGVSPAEKSWYKIIQDHIESHTPSTIKIFSHNVPKTKEACYYRYLFDSFYGDEYSNIIPFMWLPRWSGETNDPSARTLTIY